MSTVVKIYRPTLTEQERLIRERSIETALQQYGKALFESEVKSNVNRNTSRTIIEKQVLDR